MRFSGSRYLMVDESTDMAFFLAMKSVQLMLLTKIATMIIGTTYFT